MKNKFYSHLLDIEPVYEKLTLLELGESEKEELLHLFHSNIHYAVIDLVLSELDEDKKREFLHTLVIKGDSDKAWGFVETNITDAKSKLLNSINSIIEEFLNDLE